MVSESFSPSPSEVAAARRFALSAAEAIGCCPCDDLALVVSELATNACVHARSPFTVSLHRQGSALRIEVADEDVSPVEMQQLTGHTSSGRGIRIVAAVAKEWGTSFSESGKCVWAVLDCSSTRAQAPHH
jgi:two-component sensor histidine kinase